MPRISFVVSIADAIVTPLANSDLQQSGWIATLTKAAVW